MFLIDGLIAGAGEYFALSIIFLFIKIKASKHIIIGLTYFGNFEEFKGASFELPNFLMFMVVDFEEFGVVPEISKVV